MENKVKRFEFIYNGKRYNETEINGHPELSKLLGSAFAHPLVTNKINSLSERINEQNGTIIYNVKNDPLSVGVETIDNIDLKLHSEIFDK